MKRVLVISYYWPPNGNAGVHRWVKMCKYLPSEGWTPVVYTPENPSIPNLDGKLYSDEIKDIEVIKHPIFEPFRFAGRNTMSRIQPISGDKKTFRQRFELWVRGNFFIPDARMFWIRPSVRFLADYLKEHPVEAIVSTGPPHSVHLIAQRVSERTGIPWVADFRDPWTKIFSFKHLPLTRCAYKKHIKLEQSVLDSATRVVSVSPPVSRDFKAMTSTPVVLIPNGFDEDEFSNRPSVQSGDAFTLLHAGSFAASGNPIQLWKAIRTLADTDAEFSRRLRIVLCGNTDSDIINAIREAGLGDFLSDLGYLGHDDVVKQMSEASIMLLPLRKEPEYNSVIPCKVFEYLAARRPILGIGPVDSVASTLLSEKNAGRMFGWDDCEGIVEWLGEIFHNSGAEASKYCTADISEYSRRAQAGKYAMLLDEIRSSNEKR